MTDVSIVGLNLLRSSRGTVGHDQYANWGALLINVPIIGEHRTFSVLQINGIDAQARSELRCLALAGTSIRRKCHESVMGIVMESGPKIVTR